MKYEDFLKGTTMVSKTFNIEIDKEKLRFWYNFLKDMSLGRYAFAIQQICENVTEFFPNTNFLALVNKYGDLYREPDEEISEPSRQIPEKTCANINRDNAYIFSLCKTKREKQIIIKNLAKVGLTNWKDIPGKNEEEKYNYYCRNCLFDDTKYRNRTIRLTAKEFLKMKGENNK